MRVCIIGLGDIDHHVLRGDPAWWLLHAQMIGCEIFCRYRTADAHQQAPLNAFVVRMHIFCGPAAMLASLITTAKQSHVRTYLGSTAQADPH